MDPLLEQFLSEARENLAFIDQNIEEIGGNDPELLNSVFRAAHTLKGGSGIVGFESVKEITHHAEDLLDMLRAGKLEFAPSMTEALYDAFDEVMNLVEAAEESGEIVSADEDRVNDIVATLSSEMGKELEGVNEWTIPFLQADKFSVVNYPLSILRGISSHKMNFTNEAIDEEYCLNPNMYAVVFDVDESCMVYGNDPIYTLSLLGDKVLGVYSCMSDESAKSALSGTEDEEGLLLKVKLVAYIYATYDEIEESLFNFIDEIQLLPLDIATLLSINVGDDQHQIDSLKELIDIAQNMNLATIIAEVERSLELVGRDTLQYAQLERFLDIAGFINSNDTSKLAYFFNNLYKGQMCDYSQLAESENSLELINEHQEDEIPEVITSNDESSILEVNEATKAVIQGIYEQQKKALLYIENDEDLQRIIAIMEKLRKYSSSMPKTFNSQSELAVYIDNQLGLEPSKAINIIEDEKKSQTPAEEIKTQTVQNPVEEVVLKETPVVAKMKAPVTNDEALIATPKAVTQVEPKEEAKKAVVGKTVKIDQESIDSLMNVVGELLVAKNSLPYLADTVIGMSHDMIKREIMEKYIFINRLSEQLQDLIMGMRMLPISYVFDRYPKLVRDIAKKLGKKVKLEMNGGDTKLDKNMIEMLADPMIHIMRNSLDHGIETPDNREQKGKDSTGTVSLNAFAQSDRIMIEIKDDGAGINVERVANKVLEKGLLTHEQIDAMNEDEMAELVLLPGLSTAEEITEYSGRGVGMDVVKKSIESFGGAINIRTKVNKGTTITLAIPMSLAVTSLLHIQMNDIHYGIPMDSVSETVKLERSEIEYLHNEPFVYIRGEVIPLLFIKSMLNEELIADEPLSIVVLNIKDNLLAVVVNKFLGQLDVVQKPLVGIMEGHPLFSGTALLGNGQIIMAIDPLGLLGISQKLKTEVQVA